MAKWVLVLVVMLAGGLSFAGDELQGTWQAVQGRAALEAIPSDSIAKMRFTFGPEGAISMSGNVADAVETGTYALNPTADPKQLDMTIPKWDAVVLGIYKLEGDTLTVCLRKASTGGERPAAFEATEPSLILLVFKKAEATPPAP